MERWAKKLSSLADEIDAELTDEERKVLRQIARRGIHGDEMLSNDHVRVRRGLEIKKLLSYDPAAGWTLTRAGAVIASTA